jgi:hypothetical protein
LFLPDESRGDETGHWPVVGVNMREHCNFKLPKPLVILSSKGLKRNGYKRYIIYPDLSGFKRACVNCPYRAVEDKRSFCRLGDRDFDLKYYQFRINSPKGVLITQGAPPPELPRSWMPEIEAYFERHRKSNGGRSKLLKNRPSDRRKDALRSRLLK